ncbi:class II aldolase/adducin family protein [Paenibacillus antri]|uniref:Class II aldolase/adducin family protein n=1 Tax=Paenibacillus antri TaxID=2582848 RepID=A0A5R9G5M0_9BACL|nr:class II aldolase/adducin family protein [Paenibacillus antri]TLS51672.1 class II aldolase/adducin family protein [Paenibacillus antri]
MKIEFMHPADQLLLFIQRIYRYGMTTTSGGNLSVKDRNGDIWITPAGVDKGALTRDDMVCVKADGTVEGIHRPSSEFPFHRLIYEARDDLAAIVHAHPPALVSFSIVRRIPDTRLLPNERQICGRIGMAPYALPGSEELGRNIAAVFAEGIDTVMLENHGVVVGSTDLFQAFRMFETLDFCARLEIEARRLGTPAPLTDEDFDIVRSEGQPRLPTFAPAFVSSEERKARQDMCGLIRRAYDQGLFTSTQGTFSQRLEGNGFLITPFGKDRKYMEPEDFVAVQDGRVEEGKIPSKSLLLHEAIYRLQPHVGSIVIAHPPNIMAFAVTDAPFDSRTIPESYILLRGAPKLAFDAVYRDPEATASRMTKDTPIAIVRNNCVIVTGQGLLSAFDRLEVAEYSAKSILAAKALGDIVHIDEGRIRELEVAFNL